jgi:hypothetical protein
MQALLTILSIVIGIVFVLLLFSLLASTVMEMVAALLSLRGRHLLSTLRNMLGDETERFLMHPFFRQLSYAAHRKTSVSAYSLPGWINKSTFSSILADLLYANDGSSLEQRILQLPESEMKNLLLYLYRQTDGSAEQFKAKIENWFDEVMERASDWYKRSTKWWLFGIGLIMATLFNADTIQIYSSLSANSTVRNDFMELAGQFVQTHDSVPTLNLNRSIDQVLPEFKEMAQTYKETIQSPLGLGWVGDMSGMDMSDWLVKILGFILTGISVTFGAPFWFEVLKKLISIRSAGGGAQSSGAPPTIVVNNSGNGNLNSSPVAGGIMVKPESDMIFEKVVVAPAPTRAPDPAPVKKLPPADEGNG